MRSLRNLPRLERVPGSGCRAKGEIVLASKGITRSGDAYCLSCHEEVQRGLTRCPSCGAELVDEVRAFLCPKCATALALGDSQCSKCGLKFKVKTIKVREPVENDRFVARLIEWGNVPHGEELAGRERKVETTLGPRTAPVGTSDAKLVRLEHLKESIRDLLANRSELLTRMERRLEDGKARLAEISAMEGKSSSAEQIEAEVMALADEMADITMLQAHMEALSDEISSLMDSVEIGDAAKERGLAAKALRKKLDAKEREVEEFKAKEEELAKREEMVDRKIQAYAQKKKELDDEEERLKQRLAKLEQEQEELERLRAVAAGARTDAEREEAKTQWLEEQKKLRKRLAGIKSHLVLHRAGKEITEEEIGVAESDLDSMISDLEQQIASLISEKVDIQRKMSEASDVDEDIKRLLMVLDEMLGQLPEEAIEQFSKSEEFALYERMLDRFKI